MGCFYFSDTAVPYARRGFSAHATPAKLTIRRGRQIWKLVALSFTWDHILHWQAHITRAYFFSPIQVLLAKIIAVVTLQ